jgi:hypothetical protein
MISSAPHINCALKQQRIEAENATGCSGGAKGVPAVRQQGARGTNGTESVDIAAMSESQACNWGHDLQLDSKLARTTVGLWLLLPGF